MPEESRTASVVIPLWNGADFIEECLGHLLASRLPVGTNLEVLVVDNASSDGGPALVESRFPAVRLLRNRQNLGFAGACAQGIAAARGDWLALLNQDTAVADDWLAALLAALAEPTVGIAGGLALFPPGPDTAASGERIQHAGVVVDGPLAVARHRGYQEPLADEWLRPVDLPAVTGAGLAIRRDVLARCGGLDEAFWPGYYEDIDLCYRVGLAGLRVRYVPDARLVHLESSSFRDPLFAEWARLRGRLRFVLKHQTPPQILAEFLPAEAAYRSTVLAGDENGFIARAYLEAIPMALALHRQQPIDWLAAVAEALAELYGQPHPPAPADADRLPAMQPVLAASPADRLPLLGPPIRRLRRSLHQLVLFYVQRQQSAARAEMRRQAARIRQLEQALGGTNGKSDE